MNNRKLLITIPLLIALLLMSISVQPVAAGTTTVKLALKFVDTGGNALKNAYVKVYNETVGLLFEGRTDSNGWLNVTITKPEYGTYNITVWWDPAGKDYFYVYEEKGIDKDKLLTYNESKIYTKVIAVKFTATDVKNKELDYYTTTVYYNWTNKVYSASKKPAKDILLQIPYNLSWTGSVKWTLQVYWDLEYLNFTTVYTPDGTVVTSLERFPTNYKYANVTLNYPTTLPTSGSLTAKMDVRPFETQLTDWFGNKLNATNGYGIVKVMIHNAKDPSKLLATAVANGTGYVCFPQVPNVNSTVVVYWLTHEITVNTTTAYPEQMPSTLRCKLVPTVITLKDKRPLSGILAEAKVYVTWPNLLTHDTRSDLTGIVQLPPYSVDAQRISLPTGFNATGVIHGSGYLPAGETKIDVYWSITPEQPASWVNVKSAKFNVEMISNATGRYAELYVDGKKVKTIGVYGSIDKRVLTYDLICDVFDAMLNVVDINGNALNSPIVVLQHPTGAVSLITASPGGALSLVQVPGGDWRVSVVYKNVWFKPYGMSDVFSITTNIYSAVTFKFPYVDAKLKFTKWGSDTFVIEGLNVTLSWTGNATITGATGTYKESWQITKE
ncbi:MAG: Ig-like domain-containing protein, partial [Candidatus Methanomethylicia archaeon]